MIYYFLYYILIKLNAKKTEIDHYSDKEALDFHIEGKSGKIEIGSSKPLLQKEICLWLTLLV